MSDKESDKEAEYMYVFHDINRYVLLLRTEKDVEKKQSFLDKINDLNEDSKRLYNSK